MKFQKARASLHYKLLTKWMQSQAGPISQASRSIEIVRIILKSLWFKDDGKIK